MAELDSVNEAKEKMLWKAVFAISGVMITLVIYGLLQEKIMRVPYGLKNEYFKHSLFLVFCNRLTTSAVSAGALLASKKVLDPVAPVYKYCLISVTNILTPTCQYEALQLQGIDYFVAFLVTLGCSVFILFPVVHDDGSLLPCAINAACAALVDAGIPVKRLAVVICCCLAGSGYVVLDPNKLEEKKMTAFAYFQIQLSLFFRKDHQ